MSEADALLCAVSEGSEVYGVIVRTDLECIVGVGGVVEPPGRHSTEGLFDRL